MFLLSRVLSHRLWEEESSVRPYNNVVTGDDVRMRVECKRIFAWTSTANPVVGCWFGCHAVTVAAVILARPSVSSSLQITNHCFRYAPPYLWNQLLSSFYQLHSVLVWKTEEVIDGENEGGDCDEVICAGWGVPGGEWTQWGWRNDEG